MKILSWNVNGIRACMKSKCLDNVKPENADILCLQETKAHETQVDKTLQEFPHHYWNSADKKGYSGTAIFTKIKPLNFYYDDSKVCNEKEGRVLNLEFKDFFLVNVYKPNSQRGLLRLDYKKQWDKNFLKYLKNLEKTKPVVVCGDFNVAHKEIDLANPKSNYNKTAGYTQVEIDGFQEIIDSGFIDTFREFNKEPGNYTYWSYMFNARKKNIGWRIDYFLISKSLKSKLKDSFILNKIPGSDHCPVGIIIN